jgi:hypothetical protein
MKIERRCYCGNVFFCWGLWAVVLVAGIILLFAASPRYASQALAFSVGLLRCTAGFPLPSGSHWAEMNSYQHSQILWYTNLNLKIERVVLRDNNQDECNF